MQIVIEYRIKKDKLFILFCNYLFPDRLNSAKICSLIQFEALEFINIC
jgi:hypothetical protein